MPEISRFYGIIIKMIYQDTGQHNKPHVHVYYGDYRASVGIDGELLAGSLPVKQMKLVSAWLTLHEDEAYGLHCCDSDHASEVILILPQSPSMRTAFPMRGWLDEI